MLKLSVITITYNNLAGLKLTFGSIFSQTFKNFELIVIDGGSVDGTELYLKEHSYQITTWLIEEDSGIYNAQNKGIRLAKGEYLYFLNSGDELASDDVFEKIFSATHKEDLLYGNMYFKRGRKLVAGELPDKLSASYLYRGTIWHPASFTRKTLFEQYGNFDEGFRIAADYDFFLKIVLKYKVSYKHLQVFISIFHDDGVSSDPKNKDIVKRERAVVHERYLTLNEIEKGKNEVRKQNSLLFRFKSKFFKN